MTSQYHTQGIERQQLAECPLEEICSFADCTRFVYSKFEHCPRYKHIESEVAAYMAEQRRTQNDTLHVSKR